MKVSLASLARATSSARSFSDAASSRNATNVLTDVESDVGKMASGTDSFENFDCKRIASGFRIDRTKPTYSYGSLIR